jgi:hypothetical protein
MKDKKTIKREILDQFREIDAQSGDELDSDWLEKIYLKDLRQPEQKLYQKAVKELTAMGIIEKETTGDRSLRLTLKGEKLITSGAARRTDRMSAPETPFFGFTGTDG